MAKILIIDDDIEACETMVSLTTRLTHQADKAHSLHAGLDLARQGGYDLVFLDVFLPDGNGLDILEPLMAINNPPEVIVLTGKGNPDGAELAIKGGVWDYLLKPTSIRDITDTLDRALKYRQEKLQSVSENALDSRGIIGSCPPMRDSLRLAAKAAASDSNILITGETGTGKELFASVIHANSRRSAGNFVVVDCTSLTESLVESTLFGHLKGSFTGAQNDRQGLIKTADGGTLFLDEVGEMPLAIQKVFLRVLQEKHFRPVGGNKEIQSNFRLIAATNRDLDEMVANGLFRQDLLLHLRTMSINLPPLRERGDDVGELTLQRIERICKNLRWPIKTPSDDFLAVLNTYSWPGNVRELYNIIESSVIQAGDNMTLYAMHLPRGLRIQVAKNQIREQSGQQGPPAVQEPAGFAVTNIGSRIFEDIFDCQLPTLKEFKSTAEKTYLNELLRQCNGSSQQAVDISGLSRSHLYALLKKYDFTM
jgi:two-component system NtrC family response regulator